ncbi:MAG: ABC transporter substrate-binding protein [Candidatus Lokiarchaeota archaeon]|nr:ABC transporter substrate-binding protein [Candidatus Lokiarchaeota archaeon]
MDLEKKDWAIILLSVLAVASITGNGILLLIPTAQTYPDLGITIIFGTQSGPADLDPMDSWDSASTNVHDQVVEALFQYDLTDPNLPIIPILATDFGTWDGSNYTVELRDDVWFHDGTKFDAEVAKWNFDRLQYFMDHGLAKAGELYEYYVRTDVVNETTGETAAIFAPIINKTLVLDDYILRFVLNVPYGAFEALLTFNAAYMLSPTSTPFNEVIDTATGDLVGTGPFVYDGYEAGVEVRFHSWDYYWRAPAKCDTLIFSIINDPQIRNNALLSGDIDLVIDPMASMLTTFEADPDVHLEVADQTLGIQYLGMNNFWINSTVRKAISHAINYTFIIDELLQGQAVRLRSPIPEGITFANWSFNVATTDIAAARGYMQSMGYGLGLDTNYPGTNEAEWTAASYLTVNYTYNIGNDMRENMYAVLINNLGLIGIKVEDAGTTWSQFILSLYELAGLYRNLNQLYFLGWIPDYNDPSNYINPLFTNRSVASNGVQYNGYLSAKEALRDPFGLNDNVQLLMEAALLNTDEVTREQQYNRIQELLVEEDMPWAYVYCPINNDAWRTNLMGFPTNRMQKAYFYPCYWSTDFE